ncbi:MAG: hypothetical protein UT87_C0016G0012 [Candidatus Levybacteria bacterium GW2011_GWC1_40_19]|nr:MAG: hypothetical protein UT44_C0013G0014 [Candidatus Levybacteria bacterium GW2011_GWA1_39_32]KKR50489.1 MAG: hypothetical protein UT87_C0016G0012 [Candidatus Levybacteria bacterium GW2011_GWC1_40_19]KKR71680.1 MAG: hypothetical protein UU15_C0045G0004 [Candidatus Levybacteria bacterium GW2011_GWC2_40_7]KKR95182.1 MAG: hypothetical protein UU45_C0004G0085 [Candidatus Levybacteria bacterium GW2011_GWA2_41_15]OGH50869.1 MAG: hypothetical protein A3J18_01755 [Candidatus Levybacteria bacterium 
MEDHPIPQDITGFQFKLIGSMTVKQFGYIAAGIIMGWVIYILPLPTLLKIPLALLLIILGACMAFLPVAGRPMDIMFSHLIKALFSPTQYIYQKTGGKISHEPPTTTVSAPLQPQAIAPPPEKKSGLSFSGFSLFHRASKKPPAPHEEEGKGNVKEDVLKKAYKEAQETALQKELEIAKKEEEKNEGLPSFTEAHAKVMDLSEKLGETLEQKQALEKELIELQKRLSTQKEQVFTPSDQQAPKTETQNVRKIADEQRVSSGVPMTPEAPNLIMGIIKDPRGNPLGNILVEVKDAEGNPVRAFKTNGLGQFSSATSLSNGVYTVSFEDPQNLHRFDTVEFSATGDLISPLEVLSMDAREDLRRSLFS